MTLPHNATRDDTEPPQTWLGNIRAAVIVALASNDARVKGEPVRCLDNAERALAPPHCWYEQIGWLAVNPSRAISKRLRYEILRRDNHACRYCGRTAPDVKLHIDHVVPVILGGTDDPSNLVTACADCNGGKTSSAPDQAVVADVDDRAVRWAAAMTQAAEEMRRVIDERADIYAAVIDAFHSFYQRYVPDDYAATIDRFIDAGLPIEVMIEMARVASSKRGVDQRWNYFCGCCWTRIRQMQDRAKQIADAGTPATGQPATEYELPKTTCADPDVRIHWAVCHMNELERRKDLRITPWHCICAVDSVWNIADVLAAVRDGSDYPCQDPVCIASYGEFLSYEVINLWTEQFRANDVMDAADELEVH